MSPRPACTKRVKEESAAESKPTDWPLSCGLRLSPFLYPSFFWSLKSCICRCCNGLRCPLQTKASVSAKNEQSKREEQNTHLLAAAMPSTPFGPITTVRRVLLHLLACYSSLLGCCFASSMKEFPSVNAAATAQRWDPYQILDENKEEQQTAIKINLSWLLQPKRHESRFTLCMIRSTRDTRGLCGSQAKPCINASMHIKCIWTDMMSKVLLQPSGAFKQAAHCAWTARSG